MFETIMNILLSLFGKKVITEAPATVNSPPDDEEVDYLYEHMKRLYFEHGAPWKEVNIFGLRDMSDMDKDVFNDYIGIAIKGEVHLFEATTDPGVYFTKKRLNQKGVAHLCLGYYPNCYVIGIHNKGKESEHEALIQKGKVKIWRDGNNNFRQDDNDTIETGYFGINIHRASAVKDLVKIGRWSAGCQVVRKKRDFDKLLKLIKSSESYTKDSKYKFDFLLLNFDEVPSSLFIYGIK